MSVVCQLGPGNDGEAINYHYLRAHLALVFSDGCMARRMVGVGGLEGVSQVGLGEHLGPVDGLRNQNRATGRRR